MRLELSAILPACLAIHKNSVWKDFLKLCVCIDHNGMHRAVDVISPRDSPYSPVR